MNKLLLILILGLFSFKGTAQDPELFRTWYLTSIEVDLGDEIFVENINPPISPTLTINDFLEFDGNGACNGFGGEFSFGEANGYDTLTPFNYFETLVICDYQEHISFEGAYFSFFQYEDPLMILNVTSTHLSLEGMAGFILHYNNEPLFIENYLIGNFKIFPNPASNKLFIFTENGLIKNFVVYSISGKKVIETINKTNSIDVSGLSKGMYLIEISSGDSKVFKKFIKK